MDNVALQLKINCISIVEHRYLGSIPSVYFQTLPNETAAVINTKPSNMQSGHWIMIANSSNQLFFCILFRRRKVQVTRTAVQADYARTYTVLAQVCGLYLIYAAFHLVKEMYKQKLTEFRKILYNL